MRGRRSAQLRQRRQVDMLEAIDCPARAGSFRGNVAIGGDSGSSSGEARGQQASRRGDTGGNGNAGNCKSAGNGTNAGNSGGTG